MNHPSLSESFLPKSIADAVLEVEVEVGIAHQQVSGIEVDVALSSHISDEFLLG